MCCLNCRCVYIDQLGDKLGGEEDLFAEKKVILRLSQADSARQQDNFPLALKLLKGTNKVSDILP